MYIIIAIIKIGEILLWKDSTASEGRLKLRALNLCSISFWVFLAEVRLCPALAHVPLPA